MQAQLARSEGAWLVTIDAREVGRFARMTDAIRRIESALYPRSGNRG
ncbi:hypothetical protein GSY69_07280 [Brevibacterium sp. 5221]|uniref:Uncharacterized protein n=1 Tax=Brevibacterium rongguiense TaxID=2695267 RepID=A0A6N9H785_9MICO|nr:MULTISPECIES: hypothetical protein [Brevibacterium]MYM19775.1 hypothetical protein [Brevibacterium rongguiense]WAL40438.1 hypothetical protein BRM1_00735 [Brevibacterium sp. BRM-1]